MNDTSLYQALKAHQQKGFAPFHTPGHKQSGFFPSDLLSLDYTELPDTDALFEANGILHQAEEKLARLFGARRTLISSGGCTLAIQTMLSLACRKGRKMLLARNSHRSAVNTCVLLGIEPIWLLPSDGGCFTGSISPDTVEQALSEHTDIAACYLTSPTYYGELSDIGAIAAVCHRHGVYLLVDNAHGSHLAFLQDNQHPIARGADASACSLHKTLPVLTGGAALHIGCDDFTEGTKEAMALFGSTSPSYPIMASIDLCREYMENNGINAYRRTEKRVTALKQLAAAQGLPQPPGRCDPLRLAINTACAGLIGAEAQIDYCHAHGIEPEFCDGQNVVFIITPFNTDHDFRKLHEALSGLTGHDTPIPAPPLPLPQQQLLPREAVMSPTETVPLEDSEGRIAADSACPCPPGIPVIVPGEVIDRSVIQRLSAIGQTTICCKQ